LEINSRVENKSKIGNKLNSNEINEKFDNNSARLRTSDAVKRNNSCSVKKIVSEKSEKKNDLPVVC
jgi:hypothetical protein